MLSDFHIHTAFVDGELLPSEIARRYSDIGFDAIAITEHVDFSNLDVLNKIKKNVRETYEIDVLVGAEITHIPPRKMDKLINKICGLDISPILVHGESLVEPVAEGTNKTALMNEDVDILAHPGHISGENAELAKENDVSLEITARGGHCYSNGHVARISKEKGCDLVVNSDGHHPNDFLSEDESIELAMGSGLSQEESFEVVCENSERLFKKFSKEV